MYLLFFTFGRTSCVGVKSIKLALRRENIVRNENINNTYPKLPTRPKRKEVSLIANLENKAQLLNGIRKLLSSTYLHPSHVIFSANP